MVFERYKPPQHINEGADIINPPITVDTSSDQKEMLALFGTIQALAGSVAMKRRNNRAFVTS